MGFGIWIWELGVGSWRRAGGTEFGILERRGAEGEPGNRVGGWGGIRYGAGFAIREDAECGEGEVTRVLGAAGVPGRGRGAGDTWATRGKPEPPNP